MKVKSGFCRICVGTCGVKVTLDDDDRIVEIRGDRDHPLTAGHACFKGLQSGETHNSPDRIIRSQKRLADGAFTDIPFEDALDEVAEKLIAIRDRFGPDAIGAYMGGPAFFSASVAPMIVGFMAGLGSASFYSSVTIDQPGKLINPERLGFWRAGKVPLRQSDVLLFVGTNPLVSTQVHGCLTVDPVKRLKEAKARGLKLIVIDPRRTETAAMADLFLQPKPGEDASLVAGLVRAIFETGGVDEAFCADHVAAGHLAALRAAVEPFTPDYVERRCDVPAALLMQAVAMFCAPGVRGSVFSGTGPAMGAHGTLAEHLLDSINVICGRFRRAGDPVVDVPPQLPYAPIRAQALSPTRPWEQLPPSRIRGMAAVVGQKLTPNLADEIVTPGPGQLRALINDAGNIASAIPDQARVVKALRELDLLVTIEPFWTTSARISDYIFAPKLQFERHDIPLSYPGLSMHPESWIQYQEPIARPPPGAEVIDDWEVWLGLAHRLGQPIDYAGVPLAPTDVIDTERLLEHLTRFGQVPFSEIRACHEHGGKLFDLAQVVEPADETAGALEPGPADICAELAEVAAEPFAEPARDLDGRPFTHRFAVRRHRDFLNSQGLYTASQRDRAHSNPAWMHPDDLASLGVAPGDRVLITSRIASIEGVVAADPAMRPGVLAMSHGWGGLPDEAQDVLIEGANTNLLIDGERDLDPLSALARMTGFPISIAPLGAA